MWSGRLVLRPYLDIFLFFINFQQLSRRTKGLKIFTNENEKEQWVTVSKYPLDEDPKAAAVTDWSAEKCNSRIKVHQILIQFTLCRLMGNISSIPFVRKHENVFATICFIIVHFLWSMRWCKNNFFLLEFF